jgi:hypothetical protein
MEKRNEEEPHYGKESEQEPHYGEEEDPDAGGTDTATRTSEETGTDADDAARAGMRPTGSGGSAPPSN